MTERLSADYAEEIVGMKRSPTYHYGRASMGTMYLLHSGRCVNDDTVETCVYNRALAAGADDESFLSEFPVRLAVNEGRLRPAHV